MWGDMYVMLGGGMFGNESVLMTLFQAKDKCSKPTHLSNVKDTVDARHERARGIGNIHQTESRALVTTTPWALPSTNTPPTTAAQAAISLARWFAER